MYEKLFLSLIVSLIGAGLAVGYVSVVGHFLSNKKNNKKEEIRPTEKRRHAVI